MLTSIAEDDKNVIRPFIKFILTLCMSTSIAKFGENLVRVYVNFVMSTSIAEYEICFDYTYI